MVVRPWLTGSALLVGHAFLGVLASAQPVEAGLEIQSFLFTSDHGILKSGPDNFASDGTATYSPRGFVWNGGQSPVANPVSHTRGLNVNVSIAHKALPAGYGYDLEGYLSQWAFQFLSYGHSSGSVVTTPDTSETPLPNYVTTRGYGTMQWHSFNIGMGDTTTFGNVIFITWATPLETPTRKRLEWACNAAAWFPNLPTQTEEDVADGVWNALNNDPPHEPGTPGKPLEQGATWKLLDGNVSGECDEQANLMRRAVNILGIDASVQLIRASTDANIFDYEKQYFDIEGLERPAWLMMDFNTGSGNDWNSFEGCCNTANRWYAVWPHCKADSALDMYRSQLDFQQFWVYTSDNMEPFTTREGYIVGIVPGTSEVPKY